jgi:hypothetical protein
VREQLGLLGVEEERSPLSDRVAKINARSLDAGAPRAPGDAPRRRKDDVTDPRRRD